MMKGTLDYQEIKSLSKAYINEQGKLSREKSRRVKLLNRIKKSLESYYYLPVLIICLLGIQMLGFASTISTILDQPVAEQNTLIATAVVIGIIPMISILIIWYFLKPGKSRPKKIPIEGIKYQLFDN